MSGNTAETRLDSLPSPPKDAPPQGEPVAHAIPDDAGPLDEDKLSRSELVELLRCERMRAQSLETLFSQYQTECEVTIEKLKRDGEKMRRDAELAEIALAEERRLRLLVVQQRAAAERAAAASSSVPLDQLLAGGDVPPSLAAGRHLQRSDSSTGLPPPPPPPPVTNGVSRPRPDYSNAAGKPPIAAIGCSAAAGVHRALQMQEADTEAFLECLAAMEARVIRATRQAAKATAALRKGGRARGGAGAAAAKAASAEEEAVAAAEAEAVAGLKAQLQAALEELRSEQERSALLSQTCESLIRGATTARAPADKSASRRGSTAAAKPAEQGAPQPRRANSQAKVVDREEDTTFGH